MEVSLIRPQEVQQLLIRQSDQILAEGEPPWQVLGLKFLSPDNPVGMISEVLPDPAPAGLGHAQDISPGRADRGDGWIISPLWCIPIHNLFDCLLVRRSSDSPWPATITVPWAGLGTAVVNSTKCHLLPPDSLNSVLAKNAGTREFSQKIPHNQTLAVSCSLSSLVLHDQKVALQHWVLRQRDRRQIVISENFNVDDSNLFEFTIP